MDTSITSKVAELLAFSRAGGGFFEKGADALSDVWKKEAIQKIIAENTEYEMRIQDLAHEHDVDEEIESKAKKVQKKLQKMQKIYLEDAWEEAEEVLEWLGFIEGSAGVHFSLVEDLAKGDLFKDLRTLAQEGQHFHQKTLQKIIKAIKELQ